MTTKESFAIDKSGYEEYHAPADRKNMHQNEERANPCDGDFYFIRTATFLLAIIAVACFLIWILNAPLSPLRG